MICQLLAKIRRDLHIGFKIPRHIRLLATKTAKLGKKQLRLQLQTTLVSIPTELASYPLELSADGNELVYTFDAQAEQTGIAALLRRLSEQGIDFKSLQSTESSLEDIFVSLVRSRP